jgi:pullulanase
MFKHIVSLTLSGLMLVCALAASPAAIAQNTQNAPAQNKLAQNAPAVSTQWEDVDASFSYSSRLAFDRVNRQYSSTITVTNNSGQTVSGPLRIVVDASSHTLMNADGDADGTSFKVLNETSLAAGESAKVILKFELKRAAFSIAMRLQHETELSTGVLALDANQIALFYQREDGNYDDWGLHLWNGENCGNYASPTADSVHFNNWPNPYPADGVHPQYGAYYVLTIEPGAACYNFILHKGDERALGNENSQFIPAQGTEAFTFHGYPEIWYLPLTERPLSIDGARAHWVDNDSILWLTDTNAASFALYHSPNADLTIVNNRTLSGSQAVEMQLGSAEAMHKQNMPHLQSFAEFAIALNDSQAKQIVKQQLLAVAKDANGDILDVTRVQIPRLLDHLYTRADSDADEATLGISYRNATVTAAVWAPTANAVNIQIFSNAKALIATEPMLLDEATGIWQYQAPKDQVDRLFYRYEVSVYHPLTEQNEVLLSTDPYSVSLSTNGRFSQFVDLTDMSASDLVPQGWAQHQAPPLVQPEDMVIYETHIRDFSILDESTPSEYRGKYMAFTQTDSAPVAHLTALKNAGLTHIHLLPANDIATIDEDESARIEVINTVGELCAKRASAPVCGIEAPDAVLLDVLKSYNPSTIEAQALVNAMRSLDGFNWGYDPHHFAAPEGSYATDPDGEARIKEMRAMVMALHDMDLGVVLDVVYNHTASSGLFDNSVLDKVVPGYYHRLSETSGNIERSTCCENTATEHRMMAKLMNDSLVSFAQHFGFDSFRFDLMGHVPKQAVLDARAAVQAVDPDTYFYGEGWNFGEVVNDRRFEQATQFNMAGTDVGTFNDRLREAVRSAELFKDNGSLHEQDIIRLSMAGNLQSYQWLTAGGAYLSGIEYDWNGSPAGYAKDPADSINYISKHDNETLWDQLQYTLPTEMSLSDRTRVQGLAMSIPLLSQGIPFVHMGVELLRSKSMDRNTYDAGDWFNRVDFTASESTWNVGLPLAQDNQNKWPQISQISANPNANIDASSMALAKTVFTDFLSIRASSPLFKLATADDVTSRVKFHNVGQQQTQGLIVMSIDDGIGLADIDPGNDAIVVMVNGTRSEQAFDIDAASGFTLHPAQQASEDGRLSQAFVAGTRFTVPALTTAVFVKMQNGAQGAGISALPPYGSEPIYVRGSMNDWGTADDMSYNGDNHYSVEIELATGDYQFKIADENFAQVNIGGGFEVTVGNESILTNFADNLYISITQDAVYTFTLNASNAANPSLLVWSDAVTPPPDIGPYGNTFYVRGSMNGWGTPDNSAFSYQGNGIYQAALSIDPQRHQFKIADAGWSTPNIGGTTANQTVALDTHWNVTNNGSSQNLAIDISVQGPYIFTLDANNAADPTLIISIDPSPLTQTLHGTGSVNDW